MKAVFCYIWVLLAFSIISCDPHDLFKYETNTTQVFAEISDTSSKIRAGNILRIKIHLPDTIEVKNMETNNTLFTPLKSLEEGQVSIVLSLLDTVSKRQYWHKKDNKVSFEIISGFKDKNTELTTGPVSFPTSPPRDIIIQMKPELKGVYMIELSPKASKLRYNEDKRAKLITRFNVEDKHHDLLAKYLSPDNPQGYINSIAEYYENSGGIYGFRVE